MHLKPPRNPLRITRRLRLDNPQFDPPARHRPVNRLQRLPLLKHLAHNGPLGKPIRLGPPPQRLVSYHHIPHDPHGAQLPLRRLQHARRGLDPLGYTRRRHEHPVRARQVQGVGQRAVQHGDGQATERPHAPVEGVEVRGPQGARVGAVVVGREGVDVEAGEGEGSEGGGGAPLAFGGAAGEGAGGGGAEDEEV